MSGSKRIMFLIVLGTAHEMARSERSPSLFPPDVWSVYENIELRFPRTQNNVEAWHRRWLTLVGRAHISLFPTECDWD